MDGIDAQQARDHIEMVDRILAESSQRLCGGGEYFIVWGLYGGLATVGWHLIATGALPQSMAWAQVATLAAAIVFSVWRARTARPQAPRRSIVQREFFNVLWLTVGLAFVANVGAFNLFRGLGSAAIWSYAEAVVLFFIGMHGNRRAQLAGIAVVVSLVAANFVGTPYGAYVLAAGMVVGYAGFGLSELLTRE